uniref:Putative replication protein A1 n=1 Tax=Arabidopsis thaliana TaxID=3702 RepID=Q9SLD3_ARATH|nr:putative replication protein A1 [Arabidopsis thaliana]AAM15355.1 putative replication protein A1 [Arabidopsis thaliana]
MDDGYHAISELCPMITGWSIRAFVVRVFQKCVGINEFDLGLILADNRGMRSRIEATINRRLASFYSDRIRENEWIVINTFSVRLHNEGIHATSHDYRICFMDQTIVTKVSGLPAIPYYDFTPFDYIIERTVSTGVLVDVIGVLIEVGNLTEDYRGRNKEVLQCEAQNAQAFEFQRFFQRLTGPQNIIALVSWRLTGIHKLKAVTNGPISKVIANPDIPEVEEIRVVVY